MKIREKLNSMTNEELANLLANNSCRFCVYDRAECLVQEDYICSDGILQWLESEVE